MVRGHFVSTCVFAILLMLLAGCTADDTLALLGVRGQPPAAAPIQGDAAHGKALFKTGVNGAPACSSCHSLTPGPFAIGPALKGVSQRAATRVPGLTAEQYLRQSILDPNAFTVPGYRPIMYPDFAKHLSEQDVADLVAYLTTL